MTYDLEKLLVENVQRYTPSLVNFPSVDFYALMKAHMKVESNFDDTAIMNETNVNDYSIGLGQIRIATARGLYDFGTKTDDEVKTMLLDGRFNAYIMGMLLVQQITRYNGNVKFEISAYNGGSCMFKINNALVYYDEKGFFTVSSGARIDVSDQYDESQVENYEIWNSAYTNAVMNYYNQYSQKKTIIPPTQSELA